MGPRTLRRPLLAALILYLAALSALRRRGHFEPAIAEADARLARRPAVVEGRMISPLREDRRGWKAVVRAQGLQGRPFDYDLLAYWRPAQPPAAFPGQKIRVRGTLRRPRPARNPGDFDERAFLSDRGIAWVLDASSCEVVEGGVGPRGLAAFGGERLHRSMRAAYRRFLAADRARLLEGFILGYKGALHPALNRAVQDAGLIHLIVPSGAKVAFVLAAAALVAAGLRLAPGARLLLAFGAGGAYCLAAGSEPPYLRAYAAALAVQAGLRAGRPSDPLQALVVSAWVIALWEPRAVFSAGFQMTYLAMAGICLVLPRLRRAVPGSWPRPARAAAQAGAVTFVVQAALWPVFAQVFGRGSLAGFAANLAAAPASLAVLAAGWGLWLASLLPDPRPALWTAALCDGLLKAFEAFCRLAASAPAAAVPLSPWPWTSVAAYYAAFGALGAGGARFRAALLAAATLLRLGATVVSLPPELRVVYLKLPPLRGQPRPAALVTFGGNRTWLVGSVPPAVLRRALSFYGLGQVDLSVPASESLRLCRESVCFSFAPPAVHRGEGEFSIIAPRLRTSAVEVSTDGFQVHIGNPR